MIGSPSSAEAGSQQMVNPELPVIEDHEEEKTDVTEEEILNNPVLETADNVYYLGVKLPKAQDKSSPLVPKKEQFKDYINDDFSLGLQKKIAIALSLNEPLMIEGGTSIGKTTTVKKMCAELGYEVHYVNLHGMSDVGDFMGRYIPNPNKHSENDPEYIFSDGKITSALRKDAKKIKVIILDEFNSAASNILIRIHEIIDALERNGSVSLVEDASESIPVDRSCTKIISLANPPGKGYLFREIIDPAQLRRWIYQKEVTELPPESFKYSIQAMFGLVDKKKDNIGVDNFLLSPDDSLADEQLKQIVGMETLLKLYLEFHQSVKEMVKQRKVAADQPQPFTFDDRAEPRRVVNFVKQFYRGDINETFQAALKYFYTGKVLSDVDRGKIDVLIKNIRCVSVPLENIKRRGLGEPRITSNILETKDHLEGNITQQIEKAKEVLKKNFIDPEAIFQTFGFEISKEQIPDIPFSLERLQYAAKKNQFLILRVDKTAQGEPLTVEKMAKLYNGVVLDQFDFLKGELLDKSWLKEEEFYSKETPRLSWALVSKETIGYGNILTFNYFEQLRRISFKLNELISEVKKTPTTYQIVANDFKIKEEILGKLDPKSDDYKKALVTMPLNVMFRPTVSEVIYDELVYQTVRGQKLYGENHIWTSTLNKTGNPVSVGKRTDKGMAIGRWGIAKEEKNLQTVFAEVLRTKK